jgi:hypothetical protein
LSLFQLLLANNMAVVKAVLKTMSPSEADEVGGALLAGS